MGVRILNRAVSLSLSPACSHTDGIPKQHVWVWHEYGWDLPYSNIFSIIFSTHRLSSSLQFFNFLVKLNLWVMLCEMQQTLGIDEVDTPPLQSALAKAEFDFISTPKI